MMYEQAIQLGLQRRALAAVLTVPLMLAILLAGMAQSLSGGQVILAAGGPLALVLELACLCYGVAAAIHAIHGILDHIQGRMTRLRWLPEPVDEDDEEEEPVIAESVAWLMFPNHLDCAVLAGGLALAASQMLSLVAG